MKKVFKLIAVCALFALVIFAKTHIKPIAEIDISIDIRPTSKASIANVNEQTSAPNAGLTDQHNFSPHEAGLKEFKQRLESGKNSNVTVHPDAANSNSAYIPEQLNKNKSVSNRVLGIERQEKLKPITDVDKPDFVPLLNY